jgi:hypothetical protein
MDNVLWTAGFLGHLILLVILIARLRVRTFPVFTSFIAYKTMGTVVLFVTLHYLGTHAYYLGYWILSPGDYALQIAVIFEMARNVLRPTGTWVRDARAYFLLWSAVGTLIAVGLSLTIRPPGVRGLDLWSTQATVCTSLLTCATYLAMSASANRLGLLRGTHVMALGLGLAAWALIALFGNIVHLALGWKPNYRVFDYVEMFAYLGSLLFWMIAFWRPERKRAPLSDEMQQYLEALHQRVQQDLESVKLVKKSPD